MKASKRYFKKTTLALSITSILTLSTISIATADNTKTLSIDLASSAANVSLIRLAKKAGVEIMMSRETEAVVLPAIHGNYSLIDALDKLLRGSGLEYEFVSDKTIVVKKSVLEKSSLSDRKGEFALEEVIITAEKRAESMQDVPIAISAFSGETMENVGITGIRDLKQLAPSLQFSQIGSDIQPSIRGVGAELRGMNAEPGITISQDGVPLANQFMFDAEFFDVERVEVLRGPQGTISGRNATGGAINIHSMRPTADFNGGLKTTIGNYNHLGADAYLSGPISGDKLLGRIALRTEWADGWLRNTFRNEDKYDAEKFQGRVSFLADIRDDLEAYLVLDGSVDHSDDVFALDLGRAHPNEPGFAERRGVSGTDLDELEFQAEAPDTRKIERYRAALKVTWNPTHSTSLTSTTGYVSYFQAGKDDPEGTIIADARFDLNGIDVWQASQELTFTADLSDRLDLILGGLHLRVRGKQPIDFIDAASGPIIGRPEHNLTTNAVYTQWRYWLTEKLRATFGVRYTQDEKEMISSISLYGTPLPRFFDTDSWNAATPRFALDYTPVDDVTLYISASRGFKSGGYNSLTAPKKYNPEYLWNYEVGLKAHWFERRLRTAFTGFYMDYTDIQTALLRPDPTTDLLLLFIENAGAATVEGVEAEVEAYVSERLKISFNATWLDATYDQLGGADPIFPELNGATGERNLVGNRLVRTPDFQFNVSGEYAVPFAGDWRAVLRVDYFWQDQVFFSFFNHDLNSQDAYGLLNLSGTLETEDGRWLLSAFIRNALDERYITGSATTSFQGIKQRTGIIGTPRMYGLSLAYKF